MRPKIAVGLLCLAAVLAWAGMAGAQTATPAPKVQLPSGEAVAQHSSADRNRVRPHKRFSILFPSSRWRKPSMGHTEGLREQRRTRRVPS